MSNPFIEAEKYLGICPHCAQYLGRAFADTFTTVQKTTRTHASHFDAIVALLVTLKATMNDVKRYDLTPEELQRVEAFEDHLPRLVIDVILLDEDTLYKKLNEWTDWYDKDSEEDS